jgi:hypothetical protein
LILVLLQRKCVYKPNLGIVFALPFEGAAVWRHNADRGYRRIMALLPAMSRPIILGAIAPFIFEAHVLFLKTVPAHLPTDRPHIHIDHCDSSRALWVQSCYHGAFDIAGQLWCHFLI